jgi:uncharacterized protein YbjT (DUF2867 family)
LKFIDVFKVRFSAMKILVVGSTGQLGSAIIKKIAGSGHEVYAFHRKDSDTSFFKNFSGIHAVEGDLTDIKSIKSSVAGMDVVIATANTAAPKAPNDTFEKVDHHGYLDLINSAVEAGVNQFIYTSAIDLGHLDKQIPLTAAKRKVETHLINSGLNYTIFRPASFMDIYFAFMGTDIVLNNSVNHTLSRPFAFSNKFYSGIKDDISKKGRFNLSGKGDKKASFITVNDTATFHAHAIANPDAYNKLFNIGGPESLSAIDIKTIFESIYGKPLKTKSTPAFVLRALAGIFSLKNKQAGNIMMLNYSGTQVDTIVEDAKATASHFGVNLTSAKEYLQQQFDMGKQM